MFDIFGSSALGQVANETLNQGLNSSGLGSLAQYMNNTYGKGNSIDMKGMSQAPTAQQSLSALMSANGQGGGGASLELVGKLIGLL